MFNLFGKRWVFKCKWLTTDSIEIDNEKVMSTASTINEIENVSILIDDSVIVMYTRDSDAQDLWGASAAQHHLEVLINKILVPEIMKHIEQTRWIKFHIKVSNVVVRILKECDDYFVQLHCTNVVVYEVKPWRYKLDLMLMRRK